MLEVADLNPQMLHSRDKSPPPEGWPERSGGRGGSVTPLLRLYSQPLGQNGHDFVRFACGNGLTPVVGFGVAELVQGPDGGANGAEAAEEHVPDGFGGGFDFWIRVILGGWNCGRGGVRIGGNEHEIWSPVSLYCCLKETRTQKSKATPQK